MIYTTFHRGSSRLTNDSDTKTVDVRVTYAVAESNCLPIYGKFCQMAGKKEGRRRKEVKRESGTKGEANRNVETQTDKTSARG